MTALLAYIRRQVHGYEPTELVGIASASMIRIGMAKVVQGAGIAGVRLGRPAANDDRRGA